MDEYVTKLSFKTLKNCYQLVGKYSSILKLFCLICR